MERCNLITALYDITVDVSIAANICFDEREAFFDRVVVGGVWRKEYQFDSTSHAWVEITRMKIDEHTELHTFPLHLQHDESYNCQ